MFDVDFRPQKARIALVARHMSEAWRGYLRISQDGTPSPGVFVDLPESTYWSPQYETGLGAAAQAPRQFTMGAARATAPATDPRAQAREYLDAFDVRRAIFNPGVAGGVGGTAHLGYAETVARATNDWTREWIDDDERLYGAIVVSLQSPTAAIAEVRRMAGDDRMAHVAVAYPPSLLGDRALSGFWDAVAEAGLPVCLEAGGAYTGVNRGISGTGHPATRFEHQVGWVSGAQPHLLSMMAAGVFDRHPQLRLVVNGFGIAWLPSLLWRLDVERRMRPELTPARMTRTPAEYVREHVRFTTAGLEIPDDPRQLEALLELFGGEDLLMFASGIAAPREQLDELTRALPGPSLAGVLDENAESFYAFLQGARQLDRTPAGP